MMAEHGSSDEHWCRITSALDLTATRPKTDKKLYRLVQLENGLEALLISTQEQFGEHGEAHNSAAGLAVNVGSFSDPMEAQGLAHYLEHMVFMGSEKYPGENEYDEFVAEHGGSTNAWTDAEATVFHFDVLRDAFPKALDIFAQCLAHPRLSPDACDRELQAIENEFQIALMSDAGRMQQLWGHKSKPEHPMSKFSWGNLSSLKSTPEANNVDVLAKLRDFHRQYYTADRMKLVVVSNHSLDLLAGMVQESFAPLHKNTGIPFEQALRKNAASHADLARPFQDDVTKCLFQIRPVKRTHRLHFAWQLPPLIAKYRTRPHSIISHLLGHEAEGSVLAYLKQEGFATGMYAGVESSGFEMNTLSSLFIAEIQLTLKGLANWPKVVEIVFAYINMLRATPLDRRIFDELQVMAQIHYDNLDELEPDELVSTLANDMLPIHERAKEHILNASILFLEWDPEDVAALLEYFTPENTHIDLLSSLYGRVGAAPVNNGAGSHKADVTEDESEGELSGSDDDDDEGEDDESDEDEDDAEDSGDDNDNDDEPEHKRGRADTGSEDGSEGSNAEEEEEQEEQGNVLERYLACLDESSPYAALVQPLDDGDTPEVEPHFQTEYWVRELPTWLVLQWRNASPIAALHLPHENQFIPSKLGLKWTADVDGVADAPTPVKVHQSDGLHIWHAIDQRFPTPKADLYLRLVSKHGADNARSAAILNLMTRLLMDATQEVAYMAAMAELHYVASMADVGLEIKFSGFAEKLVAFALSVVQKLFDSSQMSKLERLKLQREALERELTNSALKAGSQATLLRRKAIKPTKFTPRERLAAIQHLSDEEVICDIARILEKMYVEGIVYGNITRQEAEEFSQQLEAFLRRTDPDAVSDKHLAEERIVKLADSTSVVLQAQASNAAEKNSAMELYFQLAPITLEASAIVDVIEQVMSEPAFNQLRTMEQLCYSLDCGSRHTLGVQGYALKLVSGTHSSKYLMQSGLRFLEHFVSYLKDLPDDAFQRHVQSTIKHKLQPPQNLREAAEHVWSEVVIRRYAFEMNKQQAQFLETLNKEDVLSLYNDLCSPLNPGLRVLCVLLDGNSPDSKIQLENEAHATPDMSLKQGRQETLLITDAASLAVACELYPNLV